MDISNVKGLLQSRTVWANAIGFLALVFGVLGWNEAKAAITEPAFVDAILQAVSGIAFIAGIVFRVLAKDKVSVAPLVKKDE